MTLDPVIGWVLVGAYALLFVPAAWHKARDLSVFAAVLRAYRLIPRAVDNFAAPLVPLMEVLLVIGLIMPATRCLAAVATAIVLLVYGLAIAVNLARGRTDLDCGCTGPLERRPVARWMVYRNMLLALAVLPVGLTWDARAFTALDFYAIAAALATIVLLWLAVDRLLGQVAPRGALLKASR